MLLHKGSIIRSIDSTKLSQVLQGSKGGLAFCMSGFTFFHHQSKKLGNCWLRWWGNSLAVLKKREYKTRADKGWFCKSRIKSAYKGDENGRKHNVKDKALRRKPQ